MYKLLQRVCTPKWQEISILYPYTTLLTGKSGRTSFNNRSPNIWSQYLAIFSCWCREQWFSKDKITGYSDVTNAQSRIAYITSCNEKKIRLDIFISMHNSKWFVSLSLAIIMIISSTHYLKWNIRTHCLAMGYDRFIFWLSAIPAIKLDTSTSG